MYGPIPRRPHTARTHAATMSICVAHRTGCLTLDRYQLWLFRSLAASMDDCSLTNSNRQTGLTTSQSVPWHPRPTSGLERRRRLGGVVHERRTSQVVEESAGRGSQEAGPFEDPAPQTVRGKSAISTATVRCGPQHDSVGTRSCWTWSACRHDQTDGGLAQPLVANARTLRPCQNRATNALE